jgi:endonuclease III
LLFSAQTARGVDELLACTGLDSMHLTRLLASAQLMRLPGVGCRMAQLFHKAEFCTVLAVAAVSPEALAQQLRERVGVVLSPRKAEHIVIAAHRLTRA